MKKRKLVKEIKKIIKDICDKNDIELKVKRIEYDPNVYPMSHNHYILLSVEYKDKIFSDIYIDTETYYIDYHNNYSIIADSKWKHSNLCLTSGQVFDSFVYEIDNLCKKTKILYNNELCLKTTAEIRNETINTLL